MRRARERVSVFVSLARSDWVCEADFVGRSVDEESCKGSVPGCGDPVRGSVMDEGREEY